MDTDMAMAGNVEVTDMGMDMGTVMGMGMDIVLTVPRSMALAVGLGYAVSLDG